MGHYRLAVGIQPVGIVSDDSLVAPSTYRRIVSTTTDYDRCRTQWQQYSYKASFHVSHCFFLQSNELAANNFSLFERGKAY
jgi:hypothetical protein